MPDKPDSLPQGTVDLLVLRTLATGPRHGYAIARHIEDTTGDALSLEEGSLYPSLYRMERRRWISAAWDRSPLGKDIKVYTLTARGRAELLRRTAAWTSLVRSVAKVLTS
jgi:PadR family transcriptional regulator